MIIKQIKVGNMSVFSYILACKKTRDAAVIDPGGDEDKIVELAKKENLNIKYIFNTHYHADHTCGNKKLKKLTGAKILIHKFDVKMLLSPFDFIKLGTFNLEISPKPDIIIDKEDNINIGELNIKIFHTPGHTSGGICFYFNKNLFTGDTLFVGDSGRTDLPGGHRPTLGKSLRMLMTELSDDTIIWPGHDYGPTPTSTIAWEKKYNINAEEYRFYE